MFSSMTEFLPDEVDVIEGGVLYIRGSKAGTHNAKATCPHQRPPPEDPTPLLSAGTGPPPPLANVSGKRRL